MAILDSLIMRLFGGNPGVTEGITIPLPPYPNTKASEEDIEYLAKTIYGEAEGEPLIGKYAVGHTIKNRMGERHGGIRSKRIRDIVTAQHEGVYQFSPWHPENKRFKEMEALPSKAEWPIYLDIARRVMSGEIEDPTAGAQWFYNPQTAKADWTKMGKVHARIGKHVFKSDVNRNRRTEAYDYHKPRTKPPAP